MAASKRRGKLGRMDATTMGAAFARPGLDTRVWASWAEIESVVLDPKEGYLADITLLPSGEPETAHVGQAYSGAGWGDHDPLEVGDLVLVVAPTGAPDAGLVVVTRVDNAAAAPSATAIANPTDKVVHIKPDANYRVVVEKGSSVFFDVQGTGKIELGGVQGLQPAVLGQTLVSLLQQLCSGLAALTVTCAAPGNPSSPPVNAALFVSISSQLQTILSQIVEVK